MRIQIDETELKQLVESGMSNVEIGKQLGISYSTVARRMRELGFVSCYQSPTQKAILPDGFQEAVERHVSEGLSCREIGELMGWSTTWIVRYVKRIGLSTVGRSGPRRGARGHKWSDEDLRQAIAASTSMKEVLRALGYRTTGTATVTKRMKELGIETPHFRYPWGYKRGERPLAPLEEIMVKGSKCYSSVLKKRLWAEGILKIHCDQCGVGPEWKGRPLTLQLHHKNGVRDDHRLENLQILCPNCHSQTDTFGSVNKANGENRVRFKPS